MNEVTNKVIAMVDDDKGVVFLGRVYMESDRVIACKLEKEINIFDVVGLEEYVSKHNG